MPFTFENSSNFLSLVTFFLNTVIFGISPLRSEFRFSRFFPSFFPTVSCYVVSAGNYSSFLLYVSHLQVISVANIQEYMFCYLRKKSQISHCTTELKVIVEGVYSENGVVVSKWIVSLKILPTYRIKILPNYRIFRACFFVA